MALRRSPGHPGPGLLKGDIMFAGIRARDLEVLSSGCPAQMNSVPAVIQDIYDKGDFLFLVAVPEYGEKEVCIFAEVPSRLEFCRRGGRVNIVFPEEKIVIFPE